MFLDGCDQHSSVPGFISSLSVDSVLQWCVHCASIMAVFLRLVDSSFVWFQQTTNFFSALWSHFFILVCAGERHGCVQLRPAGSQLPSSELRGITPTHNVQRHRGHQACPTQTNQTIPDSTHTHHHRGARAWLAVSIAAHWVREWQAEVFEIVVDAKDQLGQGGVNRCGQDCSWSVKWFFHVKVWLHLTLYVYICMRWSVHVCVFVSVCVCVCVGGGGGCMHVLACQPGVARAFALRAELRRFAPLVGSAQLYRFAITQARDELSERLLFHCSSGVARAFALRATCTCTWRGLLKWQYFALLCTCESFEKKPVEIGKERLRLNIIAIDHAIIRSIMRGSILNFFTRQIPEKLTDRTTKVATKLSALEKAYIFKV